MAQPTGIGFRRRFFGLRRRSAHDAPSIPLNTENHGQDRPLFYIDKPLIDRICKQIDRIRKYCQSPKMRLKTSPPCMLDILPELGQTLREILANYKDRLHILNNIEYFCIFAGNLNDLCAKTVECFKRAGHQMYKEQSSFRRELSKLSLYFSHNLTELKALFINGIYQGEQFRLTKPEATDFWKHNFQEKTIVPWEEFQEKLNFVHPVGSPNESTALQKTIDLTNDNHISIFEFDVFTRLFHPWSSLLTNWKLLTICHPAFMAFKTYDDVQEILTDHREKPGSYVFRLSCTHLGQWAIGYVTMNKEIRQTIPSTKSLVQSLIDGEQTGHYKYPNGENNHIDLSAALGTTQSDRIYISEEQYSLYSSMGTTFELCKICSVNDKNSKVQPCGHLMCRSCLTAWQKQSKSKSAPLCPFCRAEIKGFEPIIISTFDSSMKHNRRQSNPTEFGDQRVDSNPQVHSLQPLAIASLVNYENIGSVNSSVEDLSFSPPPIPPRLVNSNQATPQYHLQAISPQSLDDNYLLGTQSLPANREVLSSNENLSSSSDQISTVSDNCWNSENNMTNLSSCTGTDTIEQIQSIDDIRDRLHSDYEFDPIRIDAALVLTEGFPLSQQYEMSKLFLEHVKRAEEEFTNPSDTF
ncbi:unnamed protein product [Adineta ricciae]|uniref:E3 ubiquitin-protein ligase CBL n=1 Tax=Adineta ricciae TaxID=249248 RepID=A0A815RX53_ADIRI|nr:unnamed protein product [Adineta ricciae]